MSLVKMLSLKYKQGLIVVGISMSATGAAFGTIDNTVTVKGTAPGGSVDGITASASESVSVVSSNPDLHITKTAVFTTGNNDAIADVGEKITYRFDVKNIGNVTIKGVEVLEEATNATGAVVTPVNPTMHEDVVPTGDTTDANLTDAIWDVLAPGDTIRFTGDYIVQQSDVDTLQN